MFSNKDRSCYNKVAWIHRQCRDIVGAFSGWVKINTYGHVSQDKISVRCSGIIRNDKGDTVIN